MPASPVPFHHPKTAGDVWARGLSWLCRALAVVLPVLTAWLVCVPWPQALDALHAGVPVSARPAWQQALAVALALMPVLLMAAALWRAGGCLHAFGRGDYFGQAAVRALRAFAALTFAAGVASTVVPPALTLMLRLGHTAPTALSLSLNSAQLLLLLFAAVTWQIASVLARAVTLADEHAQFV